MILYIHPVERGNCDFSFGVINAVRYENGRAVIPEIYLLCFKGRVKCMAIRQADFEMSRDNFVSGTK